MSIINKYLSKADLNAIAERIAQMEQNTIGEIRVSVLHARKWRERKLTLEQLALEDFRRLGMEKTKARSGVLLLVIFGERRFQILADQGINDVVGKQTWEEIAERVSTYFKEGRYRDGILDAVNRVGEILAQHFPQRAGDTDELSNEVTIR